MRRFAFVLVLLAAVQVAQASGGRRGRLILGFDRTPVRWTVFGRLRVLRITEPASALPVWRLTGRVRCHDDGGGCPGPKAPIDGIVGGEGNDLLATARFADGTTCTFVGSIRDPDVPGTYTCARADGGVALQDKLHVGLCRCYRGALCRRKPCPF